MMSYRGAEMHLFLCPQICKKWLKIGLGLHLGLHFGVTLFESLGLHLGLHFAVLRVEYLIRKRHKSIDFVRKSFYNR